MRSIWRIQKKWLPFLRPVGSKRPKVERHPMMSHETAGGSSSGAHSCVPLVASDQRSSGMQFIAECRIESPNRNPVFPQFPRLPLFIEILQILTKLRKNERSAKEKQRKTIKTSTFASWVVKGVNVVKVVKDVRFAASDSMNKTAEILCGFIFLVLQDLVWVNILKS